MYDFIVYSIIKKITQKKNIKKCKRCKNTSKSNGEVCFSCTRKNIIYSNSIYVD